MDYPIYDSIPFGLTFTCGGKLPGYYADPEARCQVSWYFKCLLYSRIQSNTDLGYSEVNLNFLNLTKQFFEDCTFNFLLSFFLILQVWHWCLPNGRQFSFLCPNGTVFSQSARVCDWWFKVYPYSLFVYISLSLCII